MDREWLEARLADFPLYAYAFITTDELRFADRVRYICAHECPMYGTSWACPPAVGTVEECKAKVMAFREGLMIATITEVSDIANIEETLATRADHEAITRQVTAIVAERSPRTLTLSTESCAHCARCTYPDAPCRHPERMYPCVESYGILVTDLAERHGIDFLAGGNLVTWFSLILFE
ncbi:MAG: DUF2284 domain-containing protein [Clostridia bacterium]|nr:DUF2284 domain-containing protein [Clostridia bacterium]